MKKNQGFTLLSVLIGTAVIAVLIAIMLSTSKDVKNDTDAREFVDVVRTVLQNARKVKRNDDVLYLAEVMESRGLVPDNWEWEGNPAWARAWVSKWGRTTIGGVGNWFGENPPGFGNLDGVHVFFQVVPYEICYQAIQELATDLDYIRFQNTTVKAYNVKFSRSNLSTACDTRENQGWGVIRAAVFE